MASMKAVKVLRTVRVADGTVYGRVIVAGTNDEVPASTFDGLVAEGFVEALAAEPRKVSKKTSAAASEATK